MRQSRQNLFTLSLGKICQQHLLTEKWIVAPSLRVGHQWLDAVTRSGQAVINARVKTLKGMALDLAGSEMARTGAGLVSDRGASILIDRILNRLRTEAPSYVTKMAASPTLSQSVYASIKDIRLADLTAEDLVSRYFEHPDKASELSFVMKEYLSTLQQSQLIDYADALNMAIRGLSDSSVASDEILVIVPEDMEFTAKENALIRSVPSEKLLLVPVDQPLTEIEDRSEPLTNAGLLRWLPDPAHASEANKADDTATIFSAVGEVNEIREIFRQTLSKGIPLDAVEILHTDKSTYVPLIYELCSRIVADSRNGSEPIVTFAEGIPTTYSRPGRALRGWVSWIREGFLQSSLARMLEDRIVSLPAAGPEVTAFELLAAELRSLGIGFGRDRYLPKIDELIASLEMRLSSDVPAADEDDSVRSAHHHEDRLKTATDLRRFLGALLEITPDLLDTPTQILDSAAKFLESFTRRIDEVDGYALRALLDEINDMARYVRQENGEGLSLDAWEWLAALPAEVRILGSAPRPGRVHVSNVLTGGHSGRRHLFIVGLDDGRFPGSGHQDPVVLDSERRKLSDRLVTTAERLAAKLGGFARLLARHRGTVTLSYSYRDIIDDREMFPSPVLVSAFRIISGYREGDQRDLLQWLPRPASFAPDDPAKSIDATEWWISRLCASDATADSEKIMAEYFPHLGRGLEAVRQRKSAEFSIYDGRIRAPGDGLDPTSDAGPTMSGSMLEMAGRCPLAYFFRYVLGIKPPEDYEIDDEKWLDPLEFGNLLHEVFYVFVREIREYHWPPVFVNDIPRLKEILNDTASKYKELHPPPSEEAFLDQLRELNSAAEVFLREEERMNGRAPAYLEVSIGLAPYEKGSALDTRDPIRLKLPGCGAIKMRGRLDRIDRIGSTNNYVIVDYKTGSATKYENADPFRSGRVIQHALYTALARKILKDKLGADAEVSQFEYLFPGSRGQGLRLVYQQADLSEFDIILRRLCILLAEGSFLPTEDHRLDCHYCDYKIACGEVEAVSAASETKLENPSNTQLKYMKELRSRE